MASQLQQLRAHAAAMQQVVTSGPEHDLWAQIESEVATFLDTHDDDAAPSQDGPGLF